jgi:CubicO group peptidase (beta-lactamase class C family)
MCRFTLPHALLLLHAMVHTTADQPKPAEHKARVEKAVKAVIKAINEGNAEAFYRLLEPGFQKMVLPLPECKTFLRDLQQKYGKVAQWHEGKAEGEWQVYQGRGEKKPFLLKISVRGDGLIDGLEINADLTGDLPAGPMALADLKKRLQTAVEQTLQEDHIPSISLALVKGDRIIWAEAFGYLNLAKKVKADPNTVYVTGSIFKVVVATAVMKLVDEKKLKLDAPVNRYLKKFKIVRNRKIEDALTLRHLLTHRGGLPEVNTQVKVWERKLPIPLEDLLQTSAWLMEKPGEKERYSNLGYSLAAYVVGQVAGKPIHRAFKDLLFDPLRMHRTAFAPTPAMIENLAIPYRTSVLGSGVVATSRIRLDTYPAGDVYSTPSDMARFLIMHLNGGKYRDHQVVSETSVRSMAAVQFPWDGGRFGLGWAVDSFKGRDLLTHSGALEGFRSTMRIDPKARLGVVLFANKSLNDNPLPDLANLAIALLDKLKE